MSSRESRYGETRPRPRTAQPVPGLEKSLSAYAAAAAATGVSLLALQSFVEGKIVYTPAHISIRYGHSISLDLNRDGITDFLISNVAWAGSEGYFLSGVRASARSSGNAMWGRGVFAQRSWVSYNRTCSSGFAGALPAGFSVRPNKLYFPQRRCWVMAWRGGGLYNPPATFGQWMYTQHRYLGLKFMINGQVHYGWARFGLTVPKSGGGIRTTLTGYAYETVPNKPIITGKTKGPDVITLEPATLGRLAQGASGMSAWRGRK
jgi:hypothetical protein